MGHRFDFDLNMLVALHALIEEKSVSKAARRMGVTQPGMTYTLNKLRTQFNDQLLIRSTNEMRLSDLAAELEAPLQEMFEKVNRVIYHKRAFQPQDCELQFRLFLGYGEQSELVERLFNHLSRQAPRARLRITPKASQELLDQGLVDCMLWHTAIEGWHYCKLIHLAQYVLIARPGHPLFANGAPDLRTFASYGHIAVEHAMDAHSPLEQDISEALAQNGLELRQSAVVVSYETAAGMVEKSDLIAIVPDHIASQYKVAWMPPPLTPRPMAVYMVWHERTHRHPAHAWFRAQVIDVLASMLPEREPQG
jgi:DNA-binding transcriptional LysR family regulator